MPPLFLGLDEVLEIHRDQVQRYGGIPGVRDLGLLDSAVSMPQAGMGGQFFHSDLYEMAAACLFHLVRNHPFLDDNKRVGAMADFVFLRLNGVTLTASNTAYKKLVLAVARGKADKSHVAQFFRRYSET